MRAPTQYVIFKVTLSARVPLQPHASERRSLNRQVTLARPLLLMLSLASVLELAEPPQTVVIFLTAYLALSLVAAAAQFFPKTSFLRLPIAADLAALAFFLVFSPTVAPIWFSLLFIAFASGVDWGFGAAAWIIAACCIGLFGWGFKEHDIGWRTVLRGGALVCQTFVSALGIAYLGDRNRRSAAEYQFLARLNGVLRVEQGVMDSMRQMFEMLLEHFQCDLAFMVYRDVDLERVFLWKLKRGSEEERIVPESFGLDAADNYLLDLPDASAAWNNFDSAHDGFGWNRHSGAPLTELPRMPGPVRASLGIKSLLTVTLDVEGKPDSRLMVANRKRRFRRSDLRSLERIGRHVSTSLENLFLLRHFRARAIEAERSRISRDLHDGILQTLLSVQIQLDVMRKKLPEGMDLTASGLANLEQTVRNESAELRRFVTDLRPVRVQSADLIDLMSGFAERYRNESQVQVELLIDAAELQAPDRVCREIFQIYREALNNIKKHARASHVVVKLSQSDSRLSLVVDDNGEGFSFAGRFSGDELDRLRLGPISIKERTRTIGGVLTVESNPGHGSRLTVEVLLG
ncbi:MAG TPA: sensor histidine kinase [Candidatus Acidoferrales bacterium]|nr:sensor histidine kinase [Candidatus Acidoferrales bacterium]